MAENIRIQGGGSSHIKTRPLVNGIEAFRNAGYDVIYLKGYDDKTNDVNDDLVKELFEKINEDRPILFFGGLTDISECLIINFHYSKSLED